MKLFLKFGLTLLMSIVLTFYISGCVDTDNPAISTIDQRTLVKFVNLANFGSGSSVNVTVDGGSVATLNLLGASGYVDLPAGTRSIIFNYSTTSDTMSKGLAPNAKYSMFSVYEPLNGDTARTYLLSMERHTYSGTVTYVPGTVLVRCCNLTNDTAATDANFVLSDTVTASNDSITTLALGGFTPYIQVALSASPSYMITGHNSDILVSATPLTAEGRYAVVLYGNRWTAGTLNATVLKED